WNVTGETLTVGLDSASFIRSSVGVGLLWDSPLGPLRFDLAYPITKYCATQVGGGQVCDRTQVFRFSGGTRF
ncbi:MAG: BamA/TamA family outer membrane protein, partial [Pseudolabrys sp.]